MNKDNVKLLILQNLILLTQIDEVGGSDFLADYADDGVDGGGYEANREGD